MKVQVPHVIHGDCWTWRKAMLSEWSVVMYGFLPVERVEYMEVQVPHITHGDRWEGN